MSVAVSASYAAGAVTVDRSNYWRYYGLKRDPFVPGVRENEFYLSPRWEQHFDLIHYLCQEANVLLTIVGAKGCGKTTFLRHFIDHFGDSLRVCQLAASANLDVAGFITAMTRDFALPAPTGETIEQQLEMQLQQLQYSRDLCLITIDSAHRLTDEMLQTLLALIAQQSENQMRLHILLLGEESLKQRLATLMEQSGEKELCHHIALEPFDVAETKSYLTQRMTAAGLPAALPLSNANINRIYQQAEGVASRINAVARQVLVDAVSKQGLSFIVNFLSARKTLLLGSLTLLVILLLCAIFLERGNHRPPLAFITAAKASDRNSDLTTSANVPLVPTPIKPLLVGADQTIVINQSSVSVEKTPVTTAKEIHPNVVLASNDEQVTTTDHEKVVQDQKVVEKKHSKTIAQHNYVIQLMGVSDKTKLNAFVTKNKIKNETQIMSTQRQGHAWYELIYGGYPTEKAAILAIKELPADLQALHPWVKKVSK